MHFVWNKKAFKGKKAGQLGMGLLVGTMDIATANNTVADCHGESYSKGNGRKLWNNTEKDGVTA